MTQDHQDLHLERIAPAKNMARFYALSLETSLFGEALLTRRWGRIGTRGRQRSDVFIDGNAAALAFCALAVRKWRRGYRPPSPSGTTV